MGRDNQDDRNKILFTTEIVEIEDFIMNYKAPEIRRYWKFVI